MPIARTFFCQCQCLVQLQHWITLAAPNSQQLFLSDFLYFAIAGKPSTSTEPISGITAAEKKKFFFRLKKNYISHWTQMIPKQSAIIQDSPSAFMMPLPTFIQWQFEPISVHLSEILDLAKCRQMVSKKKYDCLYHAIADKDQFQLKKNPALRPLNYQFVRKTSHITTKNNFVD